jgi:PAT family beta-lactamase induction signal transducer AmpG
VSLAERRWLRLFTLSALFFAQGIPWGFLAITLPAYLVSHGLEEAALGSVITMSYWPYVFKFAAGPLVDAFTIPRFGRRRPWILFAQLMMAITAGGLLAVRDPTTGTTLLLALILTHTIFNAIQNVATDALAIDLLAPDERGRANGFMYGSKYAGGIVGGAGMGSVIAHAGFEAAIAIQVVVLVAILMLPLLVRERSGPPPTRPEVGEIVQALGRVYSLSSPWFAVAIMLVMNIAGGVLNVVAPVLLIHHLDWKQEEYSWIAGGIGLAAGFAGSMIAGLVADKIGHRRLAGIASLVLASGWLTFGLGVAYWQNRPFVYTLALIEPFAQSIMIVSLWSVCMSVSLKRTAATQFAAYTSLQSLSTIIGTRLVAAHASAWWNYQTIYLLAAAFQAAIIVILPFIHPKQVSELDQRT